MILEPPPFFFPQGKRRFRAFFLPLVTRGVFSLESLFFLSRGHRFLADHTLNPDQLPFEADLPKFLEVFFSNFPQRTLPQPPYFT